MAIVRIMENSNIEYFDWIQRYFGTVEYNLGASGIVSINQKLIREINQELKDWSPHPKNFEGDPDFLKLLSEQYDTPFENLLTAEGASSANFLVMAALIKPGSKVLVETPTYEPLFRIPGLLGAKVEFFKREPKNRYAIDLNLISDQMSKDVSLIIISNLHNPSGEKTSNKTINELCSIVEKYDSYLLSDEVYREFVFDSPPKPASNISDKAISTNSLTKVFGLSTLRAGWISANPSIISRCLRMKYHTSVISSPVTEKLAYYAIKKRKKFISNAKNVLEKNSKIIKKWIKNQNYLEIKFPKYGSICFPRFRNLNVTELSEMLINYYDTLIVPGKYFGAADFARIGLGVDPEILKKALENIENATNALI